MTIAILANCQGFAIKRILQENFVNVKFLDIPLIFTILNSEDAKDIVFNKLYEADFILMQPLKERFGRLSLINIKNTFHNKVISFPVLYFRFYHPEIIYLRNKDKSAIKSFFIDYHDVNIINAYLNHQSPQKLYQQRLDLDEIYNKDFYDSIWDEALSSLYGNEKNCDIIVSDYVEEYGKTNKLFHIVNHPSNAILNLLVKRIMDKIGSKNNYAFIENELLSNVIMPISPSLKRYMKNNDDNNFIIRNKQYPYIEMIDMYYTFYKSLDNSILEMNLFNTSDSIVNHILTIIR